MVLSSNRCSLAGPWVGRLCFTVWGTAHILSRVYENWSPWNVCIRLKSFSEAIHYSSSSEETSKNTLLLKVFFIAPSTFFGNITCGICFDPDYHKNVLWNEVRTPDRIKLILNATFFKSKRRHNKRFELKKGSLEAHGCYSNFFSVVFIHPIWMRFLIALLHLAGPEGCLSRLIEYSITWINFNSLFSWIILTNCEATLISSC